VQTGHTVWFQVTPTVNGYLTFSTCHSATTYDTVLEVYQGGEASCEFMTSVACNDDTPLSGCANGCSAYGSTVTINIVAGTRYRFVVGSYNNNAANCNLCLGVVVTICNNDSTPPVAQLTAPAALSCACNPVNVTGSAYDADSALTSYSLDYRPASGGAGTQILSNATAVTNSVLGMWSTAGLAHGYYYLRLRANNACSLSSEDVVLVWVDKQFNTVDLRSPVNNAIVGGNVCFDGTIWDSYCFTNYTVDYRPIAGGIYQPVNPSMPVYGSPVVNDSFATWNTRAGLPDGGYTIRLVGFDTCGNSKTFSLSNLTVDNTAPIAVITAPINCAEVSGVIQVRGTASDTHLQGWVLQYHRRRSPRLGDHRLRQRRGHQRSGWQLGHHRPAAVCLHLASRRHRPVRAGL
jgi:hypothetical protein